MAARFKSKSPFGRLFAGMFAAALIASATAAAQQPGGVLEPTPVGGAQSPAPRHLAEMLRYETALESGDRKTAELHAYAAWRAAEAELGDHRLTSILAFNYGREVAMSDPALAIGPLQRAQTLVDAGYAGPPEVLVALYLHYVEGAAIQPTERDVDPLRDALVAAESIEGFNHEDAARMWLTVAQTDLAEARYEAAVDAAGKAETAFVIFASDDTAGLAKTLLTRGVASILRKNRTLNDALAAREYFDNGRRLFPPQQSVERFDATLAELIGWKTAADALVRTLGDDAVRLSGGKSDEPPLFENGLDAPEDCGVTWAKRAPPKFPESAMEKEEFGAVVAVFDLADDGSVHNPRILAAAPSDAFNEAVLKAMRGWRLEAPTVNHPACRMNMTTQFSFVLEE